jgi:hypothetical protein
MASWIEKAEEFCSNHGFGSRGKYTHLGRMFNSSDLTQLQTSQYVCAYRPRGILSGFLVIHPELQYAVFLPSASSKLQPQRIHLRIDPHLVEHGVILSAYLYNKQYVIEDLIYIDGAVVWQTRDFNERWKRMKQLLEHELCNDIHFQGGINITCATYMSLAALVEPTDDKIVEFIPFTCGQKRLVWIPERDTIRMSHASETSSSKTSIRSLPVHVVKRDASMGPDVYTLYEGDKKLGIALVRTLAASRAVRLGLANGAESLRVYTQFNKQFDKWEIIDVPETQ